MTAVGNFNSDRYLTGSHEYIYHFKFDEVNIDKIGVEHQDKSNVDHTKPYKSTEVTPAEFPIKLPEMCIKLHGAKPDTLVYDLFMGSGDTALPLISLGVNFVGTEICKEYEMAERQHTQFHACSATKRN